MSTEEVCRRIELQHEADAVSEIDAAQILGTLREISAIRRREREEEAGGGWDDDERSCFYSLSDSSSEGVEIDVITPMTSVFDVFREMHRQEMQDATASSDAPNAGLNYAFHIPYDVRQADPGWYLDDGTKDAETRAEKQARVNEILIERRMMHAKEPKKEHQEDELYDEEEAPSSAASSTLLLPPKLRAIAYA
jgi:hypothetical protein